MRNEGRRNEAEVPHQNLLVTAIEDDRRQVHHLKVLDIGKCSISNFLIYIF